MRWRRLPLFYCEHWWSSEGVVRSAGGGPGLEAVIEALGAWGVHQAFGGRKLEKLGSGLVTLPRFAAALSVGGDPALFYRFWSGQIECDTPIRRGVPVHRRAVWSSEAAASRPD